MRKRILLLVAATTSAIVVAFVVPLALLVQNLARDHAIADGDVEARSIAILVSSLHEDPGLADAVAEIDVRSPALTSVVLAEGGVLGTGDVAADDPDVVRARTGVAFTSTTADGRRTVVPVLTANGTDVVVTDVSNTQMRSGVARSWLVLGGLGLVLFGAAVGIADRIGRRISTPVTDVAEVADRLRDGDLTARAAVEGPVETQALAESLNRLAERISELLVAERTAVGDLSHRLRTPVTALRIDVDGVDDPELAERMRHHVANLQRSIDAVVKDARRPLRHEMGVSCDAVGVVRDRVHFWQVLAEDQGRELTVAISDPPLPVSLDPVDLADALDVLIDNVFAHTPEGTAFRVSLAPDAGSVVLTVSDRGGPVSEPATEGRTGLGLQIVRRTAAAADGTVSIHTRPGVGTVATVRLPRARAD